MSRPSPLVVRAASARRAFALLGCTLLPALVHAQSADGGDSTLRLSGFGTVGAAWGGDEAWGYKREVSQRAHRDDRVRLDLDSRLGLQAAWSPSPQWEATGQLLLKPRSQGASAQEAIAQAFVAWHPTSDWTLRAGRTTPDLFLLADSRNVGFSYPWMRPSVDFYRWMPIDSLDGVDATRQWNVGDALVTAKAFAARTSAVVSSADGSPDAHADVNPIFGATLRAEGTHLTLKGTFAHASTTTSVDGRVRQISTLLDTIETLPVPSVVRDARTLRGSLPAGSRYVSRYAALSAIWDAQPWQLQAEVARIGGNSYPTKATYGYASATWRHGDVSLFSMGGFGRSSWAPLPSVDWTSALTPVLGPTYAAIAQQAALAMAQDYNQLRVQQHSASAGLRWDFAPQADFKVQLDTVRSSALGGGLWSFNTPAPHRATILSTGLDFVF